MTMVFLMPLNSFECLFYQTNILVEFAFGKHKMVGVSVKYMIMQKNFNSLVSETNDCHF